jgi:hypothetical protein
MRPTSKAILVCISICCGACEPHKALNRQEEQPEYIGIAEMKKDHTITLQLNARLQDGTIGEGYFVYSPNHPEYSKIINHIGLIAPGQSVPVRPWPEKEK